MIFSWPFVLNKEDIRLSAVQRVINQYERRSLLKVKNQMFPVIIDAPTVVILKTYTHTWY